MEPQNGVPVETPGQIRDRAAGRKRRRPELFPERGEKTIGRGPMYMI